MESWETGRDLQAVLGLSNRDDARTEEAMTPAQLAIRVPGADDPVLLGRMRALDIIADTDDGRLLVNGGFLRAAAMLAPLGLTLRAMLDEFAPVEKFATRRLRFSAVTLETPSPNKPLTWSSLPHSGGGEAPGGGGGAYGFIVANIRPMKPSGVQLSSAIVPPGRVMRRSSFAAAWW